MAKRILFAVCCGMGAAAFVLAAFSAAAGYFWLAATNLALVGINAGLAYINS